MVFFGVSKFEPDFNGNFKKNQHQFDSELNAKRMQVKIAHLLNECFCEFHYLNLKYDK